MFAARASGEHLIGASLQSGAGIDAEREPGVGGGVFVGAIDQGLVGQGGQALEAGPHLLGRTLEQAPAAQREQGVADEDDAVFGVMVGDVAEGVAAGLQHAEHGLAEAHLVALMQRPVERCDARDLLGPHDLATRRFLDPAVAAGVVGMPVGVQDHVEPPAQLLQLGQDRLRIGGVDTAGLAGGLVADEEAVVVLETGELVHLQRHGRHPW